MPPDPSSSQPLLHSHAQQASPSSPSPRSTPDRSRIPERIYRSCKQNVRFFLSSRLQHHTLLLLISLDLLSIFADITINLYQCDLAPADPVWDTVRNALGIAGLVFSCLFMLELVLSIWAFGFRYLTTPFHIFDATVIVAGFIVDVLLHGILEEIASLVVILRLWRFFKIVEEFSVGAQQQMDGLRVRIEQLEGENEELKVEVKRLKRGRDEETDVGF